MRRLDFQLAHSPTRQLASSPTRRTAGLSATHARLRDTLNVAQVLAFAGLGLLLLVGAGWRGHLGRGERRPPFHGMFGQFCFYQTLIGFLLLAFIAAAIAGPPIAPSLFGALAGTLLFALATWRWLTPAGPVARRTGNLLFSIALFLLFLEGSLFGASRLVAHPLLSPLNPGSEARIAAWRLKPGSVWMGQRVNQRGFCDVDHPRDKPSGVFRIAVIADSFGIGFVPYEHNFVHLLEDRLNADSADPRRYEVVNLSVASIGPAEYHWLLVHEALPLNPDVVICCVFTGNDFTDDQPVELGLFDRESYYSMRALRRALAIFQTRRRFERKTAIHGGRQFSRDEYFKLERAGLRICIASESDEVYKLALDDLGRIADLVSDRLLLFIIPREYQVNDAWWRELMSSDRDPSRYNRDLPNRVLQEFCRQRSIPYADALDALRATPEPTYLPRDTHWNELGNRIGARVLARRVQAMLTNSAAGT